MLITSHLSSISSDTQTALHQLATLDMWTMADYLSQIDLIAIMQSIDATEEEIWQAIGLNNQIKSVKTNAFEYVSQINGARLANFRWFDRFKSAVTLSNPNYQIARKLLIYPSTFADSLPKSSLRIFAGVVLHKTRELARFLKSQTRLKNHELNDYVLGEVFHDYLTPMWGTCLGVEFDEEFSELFTTYPTQTMIRNRSHLQRVFRLKKPKLFDNEETNAMYAQCAKNEALAVGLEVCEVDNELFVATHNGEEQFFKRWIQSHPGLFKASRLPYSEFNWRYQRCNFYEEISMQLPEIRLYRNDGNKRAISRRLLMRNKPEYQ